MRVAAPSAGAGVPVVQLFFNPFAGSSSRRRLQRLVDALESRGAEVRQTPCYQDVPEIDPQATHVCIAGGDGTVRHVGMTLVRGRHGLPVAIFPAGTVNLLAREAALPADPAGFAQALLGGAEHRPHYPVRLGETMFFACASIGPDSAAVAALSEPLKRRIGRLAYVVAFIRQLWKWPRPALHLTAPGREIDCEAAYIAKGRYFAGPWSFAPAARVSEAAIHVVALRTARRRDFLRFALAMLTGRDLARLHGVESFTCRELAIDCAADVPMQADGDIIARGPAQLRLHDFAVSIR